MLQKTSTRNLTLGAAAAVGLIAIATPAHAASQVEEPAEFTSAFTVMATPDQVINADGEVAPGQEGATGTFTFRIAKTTKVHAVEGDDKAIKALDHAARNTQGLKPVTVEKRDLFRRPMIPLELKHYDAVVFDPPRAGAEAQVAELVRANVKTIAAVSCNPLTLARDLKMLVDAGYRIKSVTPIDQFLWSTHVETVALLTR